LTLDYASPEQIRGERLEQRATVTRWAWSPSSCWPARGHTDSTRQRRRTRGGDHRADAPLASELADNPAVRMLLKGDLDATLNKALKKHVSVAVPRSKHWRRIGAIISLATA
jgi:hypothetical protein